MEDLTKFSLDQEDRGHDWNWERGQDSPGPLSHRGRGLSTTRRLKERTGDLSVSRVRLVRRKTQP